MYTGAVYDESTGLLYLSSRYYDAQSGRFISMDSYRGEIGNPLSLNLYGYCEGNP
ncbi:MAG TPA: RHS repeat-associated core domain-containing protein, partial [Mogibacterium sp.]|nr:RHS repeat-associated core domain-containing protein [Mogibacterium sp.]